MRTYYFPLFLLVIYSLAAPADPEAEPKYRYTIYTSNASDANVQQKASIYLKPFVALYNLEEYGGEEHIVDLRTWDKDPPCHTLNTEWNGKTSSFLFVPRQGDGEGGCLQVYEWNGCRGQYKSWTFTPEGNRVLAFGVRFLELAWNNRIRSLRFRNETRGCTGDK